MYGKNKKELAAKTMYKKEDEEAAYDEKINISEERKAGRLLFDKNKSDSGGVGNKSTVDIGFTSLIVTPNSEKVNSK